MTISIVGWSEPWFPREVKANDEISIKFESDMKVLGAIVLGAGMDTDIGEPINVLYSVISTLEKENKDLKVRVESVDELEEIVAAQAERIKTLEDELGVN